MVDALIGHTGFVGSTLGRSHDFHATFNSKNFREMEGGSFDLVVCAGIAAEKWIANQNPAEDRARILALLEILETVSAREFILISTVDVYPRPGDGSTEATVIDPMHNHAYGRNRFELEQWCIARFRTARIVRLPALFGLGQKKNALYDLLNDNMVDRINPAASYQWYPLRRLWNDLAIVRRHDLKVVNLVPAPVSMRSILERFFPTANVGQNVFPAASYRIETLHAEIFGGSGMFIMSAGKSLEEMAAFVTSVRG
jgi:hypothetical protein